MAKLQCARLMKFIIPSVTDCPTDSRNKSMPKATPSNRTPNTGGSMAEGPPESTDNVTDHAAVGQAFWCPPRRFERRTGRLFLRRRVGRTLDVGDRGDFHVDEVTVDLLDLADVDRLHNVARLRVDADGTARAFPAQAPGGVDERFPVGLAPGLLQRQVDQVHTVIAAD